jgi:hypothetical protein
VKEKATLESVANQWIPSQQAKDLQRRQHQKKTRLERKVPIDFRPTELDTKCKEETMFHMSIRHRKTGAVVADSGDNKFALECSLLEKLRQRLRQLEEKEDERSSRDTGERGS